VPNVPIEHTPDVGVNPTYLPQEQINSSPNAFGQQILTQLEASQQVNNKLTALDTDLKFSQSYAKMESDFLSLQGSNAVKGLAPAMDQVNQLRDSLVDTAANPMQAALISESLNQRVGQAARIFGEHAGQQQKNWQDQTLIATQQNEITQGMDDYANPAAVGTRVQKLSDITDVRAQALGWSPETTQMEKANITGEYVSGMIRRAADTNPDTAAAIYKAYEPLMDAKHQSEMGVYIDNRRYTNMMREYTQEAKQEAQAKRQLELTQTANETATLADVVAGKPIDTGILVDQLRNQQISVAGFNAIMTRRQEGTTDPQTLVKLQAGIGDGTTTQSDVYAAMNSNLIGGKDGLELTKSLNEVTKSGTNQMERSYFKQLQTVIGMDELGNVVDIGGVDKQATLALSSQMQSEWNRRVLVGKENPATVAEDMMPRYSKVIPDSPKALPNPEFGRINSLQDIPVVAQKTQAAFDAGQLSQTDLDREKQLLVNYNKFYTNQQTRLKAVQSLTPKSGGARTIGLTGTQ
jgi:hypothetical protein